MAREFSGNIIQLLHTFITVCELGGIQKASQKIFRSPAAISLQIKKLETELGCFLFNRTPSGMAITRDGERLRTRALEIFKSLSVLAIEFKSSENIGGSIKLSTIPRYYFEFIYECIKEYNSKYKNILIDVKNTSPDHTYDDILSGEADFAVTPLMYEYHLLKSIPLGQQKFSLVTPRLPIYSDINEIAWKDICKLPFISMGPSKFVHSQLKYSNDIEIPRNIVAVVSTAYMALPLVKAGMGVCICLEPSLYTSFEDIYVYPLDHIFTPRKFGIVYRRDRQLSLQSELFLQILKDYIGQ